MSISIDQQSVITVYRNNQNHRILNIQVEGKLIFNNLAEDPAVFQVSNTIHIIPTYRENFPNHDSQGRGADQGGDYQFDIYRSMKQHNQVLN